MKRTLPIVAALIGALAGFHPAPARAIVTAAAGFPSSAPGLSSLEYHRGRWHHAGASDDGTEPRVMKELHAGFQNPDGDSGTQVVVGGRVAQTVSPHLAIGGMLDWSHRGESLAQVIHSGPGPAGSTISTERELSRAASDLVPVLAYLQVSGDAGRGAIPYVGGGGGYELLFLSARDFTTGDRYDATFHGWGWQTWVGVAVPLSPRARVSAEVFGNFSDLARDAGDEAGYRVRETVNMNAVGMRFGLAFGR